MKGIDERVKQRFIERQKKLFNYCWFDTDSSDDNSSEPDEDTPVDTGNRDDGDE